MPDLAYYLPMGQDKPLVWLEGEVKTPPFSQKARLEAGILLRRLQRGELIPMPHSRPMYDVAPGCHELRVKDGELDWRILYAVRPDAIVILEVFSKRTSKTPVRVIRACRSRLRKYEQLDLKEKRDES